MHSLVDIQTRMARYQILGAMRVDMTTSEKSRLAEQMNSYSNDVADAMELCNPMEPCPSCHGANQAALKRLLGRNKENVRMRPRKAKTRSFPAVVV